MTTPGYGSSGESKTPVQSAGRTSGEPTNEPGQYPSSLFGVALPAGTGAAGTPGNALYSGDPTNEPGQLNEGLSGLGPSVIAHTGAPGSTGAQNSAGGADQVTFTRPGAYLTGTQVTDTVADNVSGVNDWTQAADGMYGTGPQLPGVAGNMPLGTGAGEGMVENGAGRYRR
jgi:hypothetical protein